MYVVVCMLDSQLCCYSGLKIIHPLVHFCDFFYSYDEQMYFVKFVYE